VSLTPPLRSLRAAFWAASVVAAAATLPFWLCPVVPTQDGPAHLYNAWLVLHLDDPGLDARRFFALDPFVPNWGGVGPLAALLAVAPPAVAEKALFSVMGFLMVLGAAFLVARLGGDAVLGAAAGTVLAHGWLTAMGFTGFQLATGLGWITVAAAVRRLDGGSRSGDAVVVALLGVAFVVLFFLHLAAALATAGLWVVILVARGGRDRGRRLVAFATPLGVLGGLWATHAVLTRANEMPAYRADARGALGRLIELPTGTFWESYSPADRPLGTALVVLVVGMLALRAAAAARPAPGRGARALLLAALAVLVAYLFVPFAAGGGAYLTDRLVPLLVLLPLPWATAAGLPWRRALRVTALVLAAAALAQRTVQYRAGGRAVESVVTLNRGVARGVPIVQPPSPGLPFASVDPFLHVWGRVAVESEAMPLDDYEAALAGWFPVRYTPFGQAQAEAWKRNGVVPRGAAVVRFE
jgi:hypothetical protein